MHGGAGAPSLSEYRIFETEQFQKDLRRISRSGHPTVVDKLRRIVYPQLRAHPHYGEHVRRLKAWEPPTWRYRIGAWRFFVEIDDNERIVYLLAASHRGSSYR